MPLPGSTINLVSFDNSKLVGVKGGWDQQSQMYVSEMVYLYDEIFSALNRLVARLGYFKKRAKFG